MLYLGESSGVANLLGSQDVETKRDHLGIEFQTSSPKKEGHAP
jgi:hypothetical protein